MNTERIVATLRSAGLVAEIDNRRTKRAGFRVRQMSRTVVGVIGTTMTDAEWSVAMSALESSGVTFVYRCDQGRGASVRA